LSKSTDLRLERGLGRSPGGGSEELEPVRISGDPLEQLVERSSGRLRSDLQHRGGLPATKARGSLQAVLEHLGRGGAGDHPAGVPDEEINAHAEGSASRHRGDLERTPSSSRPSDRSTCESLQREHR